MVSNLDSTNSGPCSTVVFTSEKNPHVNGPMEFKPALFKDQQGFKMNGYDCVPMKLFTKTSSLLDLAYSLPTTAI